MGRRGTLASPSWLDIAGAAARNHAPDLPGSLTITEFSALVARLEAAVAALEAQARAAAAQRDALARRVAVLEAAAAATLAELDTLIDAASGDDDG